MLASGGLSQVGWAALSAVAAALAVALTVWLRKVLRWLVGKLKEGYKEWFAEAIDEHVQPQFDLIKANLGERAAEIQSETEANITRMTEALRLHTEDEGKIVRIVVREELVPLSDQLTEVSATVTEHMARDDVRFDEAARALEIGQGVLVEGMKKLTTPTEGNSQ